MKQYMIVSIAVLCIVLTGCQENISRNPGLKLIDAKLIESLNNAAIERAIIAQHTLFPYHFVRDGAGLNELGKRDFAVLAGQLLEHTGPLNIRKGGVSAQLYEARVNHVLDQLKAAGIEAEQITISDGMPGGSGMPSVRVVTILKEADKAAATESTASFSPSTSGAVR